MGARILIQSGVAAGTELWIEQPVVRIGSDPGADLSIPSIVLAPHVVTVEFRDNSYRVYNRSAGNIFLGGQALSSGSYDQWLDSDILELGDGIQLVLEMDDDPSPSRRGLEEGDEPYRADSLQAEVEHPAEPMLAASVDRELKPGESIRRSSTGSTALYLAVIIACIFGSVVLLVRHRLKGSQTASSVLAPNFAQLIAQAQASENSIDPRLVKELQYAEALVVRREPRLAKDRYLHLHEALLRGDQRSANPQNSSSLRNDVKRLVEARLEKLSEY